jgi:outer membrane receptor for ferrienterochelin and colicins
MRLGVLVLMCCVCSFGFTQTKKDSTHRAKDVEQVVITAQYAPTDVRNAIHEVQVIKAEEIKRQGFNNLSEVLTQRLNMRIGTDVILGDALQIQGLGGNNVQILIDGVPVIGRVGQGIDLTQINLARVKRIEIIEGAMAAQYGSNAAGGVINIITKKEQASSFQVESQNLVENVGIRNQSLSLGYQKGGLFLNVLGGLYKAQFTSDDSLRAFIADTLSSGLVTYRRRTPWLPKDQVFFNAKAGYRFSDSVKLFYGFDYFDERLERLGRIRRPTFKPYAVDEFYDTERIDHSLLFEAWLSPSWYLKSTSGWNRYYRYSTSQRWDIEPDTFRTPEVDTTTFDLFLHRSVLSTVSKGKVNGQLGVEYQNEFGTGERIVDRTSLPINESQLINMAAWLGLTYKPSSKLSLAVNARAGSNSKFDHPLIPTLNVHYRPSEAWSFRANYGRSFRAPSLKELHFEFIDINHFIIGNTDLRAERGNNLSASANCSKRFRRWRLTGSVKGFYNYIEDRITLAAFDPQDPLKFSYQNVSDFQTHGTNVKLELTQGRKFSIAFGGAYTFLKNAFAEGVDEAPVFNRLFEMQNNLSWEIPGVKTQLNITHRLIGRQVQYSLNLDNALEESFIGGYNLVNMSLSRYFWKRHIFVSLGAKNVFDVQEVPFGGNASSGAAHSSGGSSMLLNWGRSFFARLNLRF